MKKIIILILIIFNISIQAQKYPKIVHNSYEPEGAENIIYLIINDSLGTQKSTIYKQIIFENYRYTYKIKIMERIGDSDSTLIFWELNKKEILYFRPGTTTALVGFGTTMSTMFLFNFVNYPYDKKLHALAGFYIGYGTSTITFLVTRNKWLSVLSGLVASYSAGYLKELYDKSKYRKFDFDDMYTTWGGGTVNATALSFSFGRPKYYKEKMILKYKQL